MQGKNNGEEENRVRKTGTYTSRSPFFTCYIPFQSSGSQESNASNHVRFGAEMRKIWPSEANCSRLCENFARHKVLCEIRITPSKFAQPMRFLKVWMLCDGLDAIPWKFLPPEVISYELLEGEVFNSKFCINPLEPISNDSGGRLVKLETPHNKELELTLNIMEATPEDQHSHHGHQDNPNEFRSMRDRMHPPRMSAPSCIVPPTEQLVIRPHIVPLLPTFHGMETSIDLMRLKLFPFTLKDKAKIWLNSLRPRSIRTWTDLQAEFLKKFFPTHRTNGLKRQISNFSAKENEKFYECWERYIEAINACPHHGFDTWLLAGMYTLNEDDDMKAKFAAMTRRLEELELKKMHEVQAIAETLVQVKLCPICQSYEHLVEECPTIPAVREMFGDQANVVGQFKPNNNAPYGNTYNSSWRNHPNFSWKPRAPQLTNLNTVQEKGRFPSQPHQNPKGIHEVEIHEGESSQVKDVKALITLRSVMIGGKVVEKALLDLGASVNLLPYCLQAIGTWNGLMQLTFGNMTLELNIFHMSKKQITPEEEEGPEEILPLFNKEEGEAAEEETPKLNLKPLPNCLLEVLKRCKKAIGWQISDLKGISPLVCTHHIYMEEEAKPIRQPQRRLNPHLQEVVRAEEKTTFTCPFGTYAYRRMPFGLCNAPATFQRCMLSIFSDMVERIMEVFMDDITVYGGIVLGHIIFEKGIEVDKAKVKLIVKLSSPTTMKGVRQFLGSVLGQREDGKPYVIYYASKTLNEAQMNYITTEKELLAVVFALDKFRAYLVGSFIIVFTTI
ncbi:hypothetical protein AAG906_001595 [Vitis piasezkii]